MKRQFAILFALTFMVSGLATMAEEAATDVETTATEVVETEWVAPFEDGDWLSVPEWNAEVYLPTGWMLTEVTENGFIAADAEAAATMTVTLEDFIQEEAVEEEATDEEATDEETTDEETTEGAEVTAFESYLIGLGQDYQLALMGERQAAVLTGEEEVSVKFVMNDQLVTLTFAPATEGGVSDSALIIAETFHLYDEVEPAAAETELVEETETESDAE